METPPPAPWIRPVAIGGGMICGGLAVLGLLPAAMSPMMFDAPGSVSNPLTVALFLGVASAPFVMGASALLLIAAAFKRWRWGTFIGLGIPVALVIYVVAVVALMDLWCGGNFTCK